ncbi:hypothetical protein ACHQM5_008419 [Ranunculus cassubicifolius]
MLFQSETSLSSVFFSKVMRILRRENIILSTDLVVSFIDLMFSSRPPLLSLPLFFSSSSSSFKLNSNSAESYCESTIEAMKSKESTNAH